MFGYNLNNNTQCSCKGNIIQTGRRYRQAGWEKWKEGKKERRRGGERKGTKRKKTA